MHDDAPPQCPRCAKPLRKLGEKHTAGGKPEDANYLAAILYRCGNCRLRYVDEMDGEPLRPLGAVKKRE